MARKTRRQTAGAVAAALVVLAGAGACSAQHDAPGESRSGHPSDPARQADNDRDRAQIRVDRGAALADRAADIRVTGLQPHQRVTVAAHATDQRKLPWGAEARFTADARGTVDLDEQAPRGGKPYAKADSMGLLSAMLPQDARAAKLIGSGDAFSYHPPAPALDRSFPVRLTVSETPAGDGGSPGGERDGRELADRDLTRTWLADGVEHRRLTLDKDGADAELYTPPKGSPKKAPVLVFGGSEGGNSGEYAAALLASHGHPAMSLCYFDCGKGSERPKGIDMIDLDYFTHAARLLAEEPSADPKKLAVMGNSRGSEVAQLLGQRHPELVRDVIAYAPSSKINGPYNGAGPAAWAEDGKPIPAGPIRLDRVRGKVLAVAGGNDKMWGSAASARDIAAQRGASGQQHQQVTYPDAGHHVNWFPYGQPGQEGGADGAVVRTSAADQQARADSWPRVLQLLAR